MVVFYSKHIRLFGIQYCGHCNRPQYTCRKSVSMPGGSGRTAKGRRGRKACRSPSTGSNADLDSLLDDPDIDISRPSADEDTAQSEVAARPTPEPDEQAPEELNPEPDHETASDGGSASSRSKRSKKKKKKTCHLRDENEEALTLEWIAANPILWNTRDKEFKRKDKKDRLWEEKAEEMGYDGMFTLFNICTGTLCRQICVLSKHVGLLKYRKEYTWVYMSAQRFPSYVSSYTGHFKICRPISHSYEFKHFKLQLLCSA